MSEPTSKPTTPALRVDTKSTLYPHGLSAQTPSSATPATVQIPLTPSEIQTPPSPHLAKLVSFQNTSHAKDESRKLLALLVDQLLGRPKPPSVFEPFGTQYTTDNTVKSNRPRQNSLLYSSLPTNDDSDKEDDSSDDFSTDSTFELMVRLKEVLLFSVSQGWQIFEASVIPFKSNTSQSPKTPLQVRAQSRRSGIGGKRSKSSSPTRGKHFSAPELLSQCISLLASVISEDCRFQSSRPRPSRPVNSLQWISLDVAQLLVHCNLREPTVISQVAFAVIPAFSTFPSQMYPRLLAFFDNVILRGVLEDLCNERGYADAITPRKRDNFFDHDETPNVSIRVVEVPDEEPGTPQQPALGMSTTSKIRSSNAPLQPLSVYHLSAVSSPLLAAVLETVDAKASSPLALHNFYRLIETLVSSKKDSYLDILQIVAYHTSESRRTALTLLATFWPAAMGHIVVSKALPVFSYAEMLAKQENGMQDQSVSHQYAHNFIPWRFVSSDQPVNFQQASLQCCRSCTAVIRGFGLLCTTCMCAVHFDCYDYPDGNVLLEHAATAGGDSGKMVVHRYCLVSPSRLDTGAYHVRKANHNFVLAHIFTLPLCILCRDPIWGFRALLCTSCRLFAHFSCVSSAASEHLHCGSIQLDSSYMTVSLPRLRQSFTDFYGDIFLSSDDLGKRTYEEISVSSSVLWTQLQIYNNGLALGSFSVSREGTNTDDRDFELPYLVELYEAYLSSGKLPVSTSLAEYIHTNSQQQAPHLIMFDWSTLAYIASTVKAPYDTQNSSSGGAAGFLRVDGVGEYTDGDIPRHPYEVVPLGHIYGALGHEFNVVSEGPARHFLSHLQKLGFLCCTNPEPFLPTLSTSANTECYFPLPLGFDLSVDVETLVSAIESCLSDLDLSVNECGLLLLVRRFSPNGLMSEYALHRLTRTLVGWILSEDDSLATILRDYVSGGRRLPGVRAPTEPIPWPYMQDSRRIPTSSVNNGGDYIASRRNLLHTYGGKWLLALHNQDISAYPAIVFDATHEIASDCTCSVDDTYMDSRDQSRSCYIAERCLKFIVKLSQASVTFTALDDLFLLWLKSLEFEVLDSASMPMLQRLLNRDNDSAARFSTYVDATLTNSDEKGLKMADLWGAVWQFTRRTDGLTSGLMWLRLFARSGVEVDTLTITKYSNIIFSRSPSLAQGSIFMDAVLITTWLRSVGRQDLQPVVGKMMRFFRPAVETSLQSSDNTSTTAVAFVRRALTTCLLLYGCDRRLLLTLDMADKAEVHQLPVRRKLGVRTEKPADPIIIDQDLMFTLDEYFRCGNEEIAGLAAKFLHSFMMNSPYLETFEVDNFVLRNAKALCSWVWQLYGIQQPSVSSIRTSLLSRILVVDVVPFRELLAETFSPSSPWEPRLVGASRLFRIIMDVKSPTFQVKDRPWKICVLDIFYFFFQLIWLDKKEEIRTAVETWTQTLLTPQLEVIASCWNTALPVLQPLERLQLAVFLTQLQPHFPTWKFLSWDVIIEVLQDDDQTGKKGIPGTPIGNRSLANQGDSERLSLKVALILLSLQMMESGMEVDILSCLKLKYHLAKVLGFSDVESVPTASGRSFYIRFEKLDSISATTFPCVQALPRILDAHHNFDLPPVVMGSTLVEDDKPCRVLVGTIFVDLVLAIFCSSLDLLALPILTLKSLLEALMIITFKHDFGSVAIRHLDVSLRKALRKTLDLLLLDVSYELRQLALSVIQTFIRRGTAITGVLAVESMDKAAALIIALKHNNEDALVSQAKAFVESTLVTLVPSGIFCSLCKRPPNPDFYEVLKTIIQTRDGRATEASINFQEDLLHSIISQPPEVDWKIIHNTVENINMFVEVVLCEGVSDQTLKDLAAWIVATARRAAGFSADKDFDLNTLLSLTANLLRFKRSSIRHDLIICVETVFRIAALRSTLRKETILLLRTAALTQGYTMSSDITVPATQTLSRIMVEIVDDILRLKVRAIPTTLASLVEVFMSQNVREHGEDDAIQRLARSAIYFLQNHSWTTGEADADLTLSLTAGRYIFYAAERGHDVLDELNDDGNSQRSFHSEITIRPWIVMLLSAVSTPSSEKYGTLMMSRFDNFVVPYTKTLGTYVQGRLPPPETAAVDIEYTYLAMKSWLLLLHKLSTENTVDPRGELTHKIWNELWPPFESLAKLLGQESSDELLPLSTAVWSSVANLFIFVLQSRSPIAMDCIPCLTLLQHLKQSGRRNSALSKLARALDGNVLPELQLDAIIAQTIKDTANADKLRRLDRHTKAVAERRRVPT